jgi:hypothetical protein
MDFKTQNLHICNSLVSKTIKLELDFQIQFLNCHLGFNKITPFSNNSVIYI